MSRRFAAPVAASILVGVQLIALTWVYLLATSVRNAFNDVIAVTGQLFAICYILLRHLAGERHPGGLSPVSGSPARAWPPR